MKSLYITLLIGAVCLPAAILGAQVLVSTVAGSSMGRADGPAATAQFNLPRAVVDGQGMVYVADTQNYGIRRISPAGVVSTIGGNGGPSYSDAWLGTLAPNLPHG